MLPQLMRKLSNSIRTLPLPGLDSVWFGAFFTTTASIGNEIRRQRLKRQQIARSHSAPELGEAWLAQGTYRYRVLHDVPGALEAYREAEKRLPNSCTG